MEADGKSATSPLEAARRRRRSGRGGRVVRRARNGAHRITRGPALGSDHGWSPTLLSPMASVEEHYTFMGCLWSLYTIKYYFLSNPSFVASLSAIIEWLMTQKSELGQLGEDLACRYLKKKGYKIIERNYRQPWGELDIVAVSPEKILVLVEVKTVRGPKPEVEAEDQMTRAKSKKFKRAAELYANNSKLLNNKGWRVDLVAVTIDGDEAEIKHYENV